MSIKFLDKKEAENLADRLDSTKHAVGVLAYLKNRIQLVKRVNPPYPGKYSVITGSLDRHEGELVALGEVYEELYSTSLLPGFEHLFLEYHGVTPLIRIGDIQTGFHIVLYGCQLQNNKFIPYTKEVVEIRNHTEVQLSQMNPLTQFILWARRDLQKEPLARIRWRILTNGLYIVDYST